MTVVYRDKYGIEYVSVPLPSHEVTEPVPLEARVASKRAMKRTAVPFYQGTDGANLAAQPRTHRRHWSDSQWGAFEEYCQLVTEESRTDSPVASVIVIKPL